MIDIKRLAPVAFVLVLSCAGGSSNPSGSPSLALPDPYAFPGGSDPTATPTPGSSPSPSPTATASPATTIRFVAIGDTGQDNAGQYEVAAAIDAKCKAEGCDFGILLGDNVYPSGVTSATDPQWGPKVADAYEPLGFPFYAVLGNHDYGNSGGGNVYTLGANQVAYSALHPWFRMPAEWYAFDEGNATFLATGNNLIVNDYQGALATQTAFFQSAIAASDKKWKISLGHFPYLSNGPHGNAGAYDGVANRGYRVKKFYEDALCDAVDLHLFGHDHSLQALPGNQTCPGAMVVSGAGATTSSLPGSNDSEYQSLTLGFAYVVVTDTSIVLEFVDRNGTTRFTKTITK